MQIDVNELQALVHRGARAAYEVDHHFAESIPFEEWLREPNMILRVAEECRRVIEGETQHAPLPDDEEAIRVAYNTAQGFRELAELARLANEALVS